MNEFMVTAAVLSGLGCLYWMTNRDWDKFSFGLVVFVIAIAGIAWRVVW